MRPSVLAVIRAYRPHLSRFSGRSHERRQSRHHDQAGDRYRSEVYVASS